MEISEHGRVTRATAFAALFAAGLMLVPSLMFGNQNLSPAENASAAFSDRILRIGWADYFGNINTLNPHVMTMGQEYMLVYPCYSELLTYDENGELIGDLATKWTVSPDGKDWHFWITHTASFYDKNKPAVQERLTVDDVIYSFNLTQTSTVSLINYYFPKDPATGAPLITSFTKVNDYEMIFHLRESFGPFMSALTGVPIVPKYIWEGKNIQWANYDSKYPPCVGSGMYYYNRDNIADIKTMGASMVLNPTYFGIAERGWMPRVYEWRVYSESKSTALANFQKGTYDILIAPTPAEFRTVAEGGDTHVKKFQSSQGFVLDFCMNQLTPELRTKYGMDARGDWNNQLLLNPIVKRALKMSVNRTAVVDFSLDGGGSPADSLMPKASTWYYHYGSDPANETPGAYIPYDGDRVGARQLLLTSGWHYRTDGSDLLGAGDQNTYYPLCRENGADKLEFRYQYCDWYDFIIDEGVRVQAWAAEAGINLVGGPATSAEMNADWKSGDYDIYLWDWWFNPLSEPSLDVCELYSTNSIGNNTDVNDYWPWVDEWYYASLRTGDYNERKELINKIQRYAYENSGYWAVAYRDNLYLAQTVTGGKGWTNWGDWVASYTLCPDSDYWWLFMNVYPEDNPPPTIGTFSVYPTDTTTPMTYTVTVTDMINTMEYKWIFGDGTNSSWSPSYDVVKTFADDGYYEARLVVRELDGEDHFVSFAKQTVAVVNLTNQLPVVNAWTPSLGDPTAGEIVSFTGSATDVDDPQDRLSYSWDFGDGSIGLGKTASHRFGAPGIYSVKCRVDDGHLGTNPRPATRNQDLQISSNAQPHITVSDITSGVYNARPYNFTLTDWGDSDIRDILKYTWDWGDDEPDGVTYTPYASHIYKSPTTYNLTVWADDQTMITSPSHNVSDWGLVSVQKVTGNAQPSMTSWGVSTTTPWNGSVVTFWANATDGDGDLVYFNFTFGDGTYAEAHQSAPNTSLSVTHVYTRTGTFITRITYTDLIANTKQVFPPSVAPHGAYFDLHLDEGWNFMSVPLVNYGYMASTLGLVPGEEIVAFDPAKQDYDTPYVEGWPIGDFAINGSTGYWVYSNDYKTVRLFGDAATAQQSRAITVPVGGGWAMIAVDSLTKTVMASDIPGFFTGGSVTEIVYYDPLIPGGYGIYIPGWPFDDFEVLPGKAYWIWCSASGTLSYLP